LGYLSKRVERWACPEQASARRRGRWRSNVRRNQAFLPNAIFVNGYRRMIAPAIRGSSSLDSPSNTPCSVLPHLFAGRTNDMRTFRTVRNAMVAEMHILERGGIMFLNGFPT
jgi:hypothetical protein